MSTKREIKVVKAFYLYHPDFINLGDGKYETLKTGRWITEWQVKERNNPILEHYKATYATEEDAKEALNKISKTGGINGDFVPWEKVDADDPIFTLGKLFCFIDPRKNFSVFYPRDE